MAYPKGKRKSEASKVKQSESLRRFYVEHPEARQKMAEKSKGRTHSDATKDKMSEARTAYWRAKGGKAGVRVSPRLRQQASIKARVHGSREDYLQAIRRKAKSCPRCGEEFLPKSSVQQYCSRGCAMRSKNGRIVNGHGYIAVKVDGRYVLEHRLIMSKMVGRPLDSSETVHHRDGDKQNNAESNLELRTGRHGKGATNHCPTCTCDKAV